MGFVGIRSKLGIVDAALDMRQGRLYRCASAILRTPDSRTIAQAGGLSDHTLESAVPTAAVALGACVIEKHVTLSREDGGPDAAFSLEPGELAKLVHDTRTAWEALGNVRTGPKQSEMTQRPVRRSLYIAKDMKAGEQLTSENLRSVRPGQGLAPRYYHHVIGRKIRSDLQKGRPLDWTCLV